MPTRHSRGSPKDHSSERFHCRTTEQESSVRWAQQLEYAPEIVEAAAKIETIRDRRPSPQRQHDAAVKVYPCKPSATARLRTQKRLRHTLVSST